MEHLALNPDTEKKTKLLPHRDKSETVGATAGRRGLVMNGRNNFYNSLFSAAIGFLSLVMLVPYAGAQAPRKPLTQRDVITLLRRGVSPNRVEELAHERGIDFELTPETETQIRKAGGTDELLNVLRGLAPKQISPPPTPSVLLIQSSRPASARTRL
jgi:hypothetical protein